MKLTGILFTLAISVFGVCAYYYTQIESIEREILIANQFCEDNITETEQSYNNKIKMLNRRPTDQAERQPVESHLPQETNLNQMVSYGHQVRAVAHKYEFLLETAQISTADKNILSRLLRERELLEEWISDISVDSAAVNLNTLKSKLSAIEEEIKQLLTDQVDYDRYNYLKEKKL